MVGLTTMIMRLWLDNPITGGMLFFPRRSRMPQSAPPGVFDGVIAGGAAPLGYRLYTQHDARALLLLFHGNGEIVADYDAIAPLFHTAGVALLVAEYRGYGWSGGRPQASKLLSDAERTLEGLPDVSTRHGMGQMPLFVMGRSLGSAPAIHLAHKYPGHFSGLIIESGFYHAPSAPRWPPGLRQLMGLLPGLFGNGRKMRVIELPLLLLHGEDDRVIRVQQGQALYNASPSQQKTLLRIPGAGHNDLMIVAGTQYFAAVQEFVAEHIGGRYRRSKGQSSN